ncbi:MAG: SRPBCC family protein [Bradyrhizobium sp.]
MTVAFKLVREAFTSRVTLDRPQPENPGRVPAGAVQQSRNRWSFEPKPDDGCDVGFFLSYEFKSRMLAMLMGTMFDTRFSALCRGVREACGRDLRQARWRVSAKACDHAAADAAA